MRPRDSKGEIEDASLRHLGEPPTEQNTKWAKKEANLRIPPPPPPTTKTPPRLPAKSTQQTIQVVALPQEIMRCLSSTECWSLRFRRRFVKEEYSAFNEKYCIRPSTHPFIAKETTAVASGGHTGRSSALRLFSLFARRGAALFVNVRRRRRSSLRPSVCPSVRLSVRPSLLRTAIHIHNGHEPRACDLL